MKQKAQEFDLSRYQVGGVVDVASARLDEKKTQAPPPYTEATLLYAMENAHLQAANDVDREMLKATKGIGTARTRGEALNDLLRRNYIERSKKGQIRSTPLGQKVDSKTPESLKAVVMTAKWELAFSKIAAQEARFPDFMRVMKNFVQMLFESSKKQSEAGGTVGVNNTLDRGTRAA
jgi:DNA topoisomerase-3